MIDKEIPFLQRAKKSFGWNEQFTDYTMRIIQDTETEMEYIVVHTDKGGVAITPRLNAKGEPKR